MSKGIYKRGNVYWIRYAGLDGRTVRESSCGDRFKVADALLIQRRNSIKEGEQPEIEKIESHNFKELVEKYQAWIEGRQKSAKGKGYIIGKLQAMYGSLPLRGFNTLIVEQLQTHLMARGLKNASCNKYLNIFKHMFTKAVDWNMVDAETLKRIRKVKLLQENNKRLRFLSKEECQELINVCEPHLKPIVITALNTGCRKGEILSLKWDNVDLKHGFISLILTKNGERREIPINDSLRATLQGLQRRLDIPYVFYDATTCKPYGEVKRSFHTALRRAVIKDFKFHDLRHTFASHLVMAGADITTVSRLLGHKSLTMTLRYSHLAPEHMTKAVNMLDLTGEQKRTAQLLHNQAL